MINSIFQRLLFTYAVIIVLVVILLAALLTYFFNIYLFDQKQKQLLEAGRKTQELAVEFSNKNIDSDEFWRAVNTLGSLTDSRINVIISKRLADLKSPGGQVRESLGDSEFLEDIRQIVKGETLVHKNQFSNQLNTYVVFVGMPVYVNEGVSGVILLHSPLDQINNTLFEVYKIIWGTAAASLALAAVIIFIVSRRISKPIENIQKSAAAIAEGSFTEDVEPEGRDEIAQLAGTFNYMKNRLKQVEEMRKDLIANVSHELRTPLTSIRGFVQSVLEGIIRPEEQEKYLRRAYEETGRLSRLVNDLLELARIQAGSLRLNLAKVDVGELIGEIIEESRLMADKRQISLGAEAAAVKLTAYADRDRLKQVILNLLHNAISYSNDGGSIWIRSRMENGKIIIGVEDNGPGIPEDQLDLIFEKFHRVEKSRSQALPGTGLGLSIARELVELHGGAIFARSQVGRGTEITFTLPIK